MVRPRLDREKIFAWNHCHFPVFCHDFTCKRVESKENRAGKYLLEEMLVPLAMGFHLFPFRTESLSPSALMVLRLMPRESKSVPTQTTRALFLIGTGLFLFRLYAGYSTTNAVAFTRHFSKLGIIVGNTTRWFTYQYAISGVMTMHFSPGN